MTLIYERTYKEVFFFSSWKPEEASAITIMLRYLKPIRPQTTLHVAPNSIQQDQQQQGGCLHVIIIIIIIIICCSNITDNSKVIQ